MHASKCFYYYIDPRYGFNREKNVNANDPTSENITFYNDASNTAHIM
jgi:hypothetical protein